MIAFQGDLDGVKVTIVTADSQFDFCNVITLGWEVFKW